MLLIDPSQPWDENAADMNSCWEKVQSEVPSSGLLWSSTLGCSVQF